MRYVICYDIADDRRRGKVAKLLEGLGRRVQKSVFECDLTHRRLQAVMKIISNLMEEDDCCSAYAVCLECLPKQIALGKPLEPEWGATIIL